MLAALKQLFSPSLLKQQAYDAYVQIVKQARQPVFYSQWQVEDTVDGRFDVIVLHIFLLLSRLEEDLPPPLRGRVGVGGKPQVISLVSAPPPIPLPQGGGGKRQFNQYLCEAFFDDMDRSLREMGASDTGVGIRVKKMAQAFYGRMKAYTESLGDETALAEALRRNVYREKSVPPEIAASMAAYMGRNIHALKQQSLEALQHGVIRFSS